MLEQVRKNEQNFVWSKIQSVEDLDQLRTRAMELFTEDFETGLKTKRYVAHSLPDQTQFENQYFDLGLSSHFLIIYSKLGIDFHIGAISEMIRICREIRIFPLLDLNARRSQVLDPVVDHFSKKHHVEIKEVDYEFQRGGNKMLVMR